MGCSPSKDSETPVNAVGESNTEIRLTPTGKDLDTVIYAHLTTGNLKLDIFKPLPGKSLHRAILLIHGGGWLGGTRQDMHEICKYLTAKGFVTASVDYRLSPVAIWPAQLDDVQTAVRYLRANAKALDFDPAKMGAAGISAGGHLSMFLGTSETRTDGEFPGVSSRVQAVGSISGIHDLNASLTQVGESYGIVPKLVGETGHVDAKARKNASPITFFDAKTAPTLFIQGKVDPLVPPEQSLSAEKKLKSLGVSSDVLLVEGMKHGLSPVPPNEVEALDKLGDWMTKYLK